MLGVTGEHLVLVIQSSWQQRLSVEQIETRGWATAIFLNSEENAP